MRIPKRASRGPRDDRREKLLETLAAAQRFYSAELAKPGSRAAAYLEKRGVPQDFVKRLSLGHAPDAWDALATSLSGAFPESLLAEAGLVQPRSEGRGHYDRFRDRLLFVVRDERGRAVGFGGRALSPEQEPKYLNSPESPVFLKKRLLYGLSEARDAIRKRDRVVLVEGYFDHLALLQAGIDETVASMGTALTPEQAEKLRRLCPAVIVCYDGDSAGRAATRTALQLLLAQGFRARVARLPEGEDPHDVLRQQGASVLAGLIDEAPDFLKWLLETQQPNEAGISGAEKQKRTGSILEVLASIPDAAERQEEVRKLAYEMGALHDGLWQSVEAMAREKGKYRTGTPRNAPVLSGSVMPPAERRILQILLTADDHNQLILGTLKDEYLTDPLAKRIVSAFRQARAKSEGVDFHGKIAHLTQEDRSFIYEIASEELPEPTEEGVGALLKDLTKKYLDREGAVVQQAIARGGVSEEELDALIRRKQDISRRRSELGR